MPPGTRRPRRSTTLLQLDVLADAGVVDAGGRGLLVLIDALTATVYRPCPPAAGTSLRRAGRNCDPASRHRRRNSR